MVDAGWCRLGGEVSRCSSGLTGLPCIIVSCDSPVGDQALFSSTGDPRRRFSNQLIVM
jgi:hypothetical protein